MMKTKRKSNFVSSASEDSSDADENIKTHSDDESDHEEDLFHEEDEDLVSTQIAPKDAEPKEESVKLKLARALMKMPCAQSRNTAAFKRVQWDKVEIPGCSEAELKEHLREILKMTSAIRTLGEILADFERNENRFTSRIHKDFPTRPSGAHIKYLAEHRDEITQILEKKNPGEKVSYMNVMKLGAEMFHDLSAKKQEKYKKLYHNEMIEYKKKVAKFYEKHPELKPKITPRVRGQPKELSFYTSIMYFRESLNKDGNPVALAVAQKMWRALPPKEKGRYINELANLETELPKRFSKLDHKLLDSYNGIPSRPYSNAYNVFVRKFNQNYHGDPKQLLATAAEGWKNVTPEEKARYQKTADKEMDDWIERMKVYIETIPPAGRAMVEARFDLKKLIRKRKSKALNEEKASKKIKIEENLNKSAISYVPHEAFDKGLFSDDSTASQKKKKKNGERSPEKESPAKSASPEKSPKKKKKLSMPEYPSQSTAHYFMTKVYDGKPKKVAKAYLKLDRKQKKAYREKCVKERNDYLQQLGLYMAQLDALEKTDAQKKIVEARDSQKLLLDWHTSTGTDDQNADESSSSSDDDSDSS